MAGGEPALYVYALAEPGLPGRMRILRHALRTLAIGPIDAVVEVRRTPVEPAVDTIREQHAVLVTLAARSGAILPARFGSQLSEPALRSSVAAHRAEIAAALDRVRGCVQMTIRVFGEPDPGRPGEERASGGAAYLKSRRDRARHLPPEVASIRRTVGPHVSAERVEPGEGACRVTVYHLVPGTGVAVYRKKASALRSGLAPFHVTVTGPWPPFAFSPELF